jgi:hypothetical protein
MPRLSENAISFFGAGGHKHDGVSSTLISTDKYSLFDFNPGYRGSQSRITIQQANQAALEEWVMNLVNTKVLAPAGLDLAPGLLSGKSIRANTITATELQANTITADEIAANAVTANELAANLVLVNNVIRSNNYNGTIAANGAITANGNAGWAITSFGSAEFANAVIRGNVTANAGSIGGWTISSNTITAGSTTLSSTGAATFGGTVIASNGQITNGGYTLSNTGVLTATGANINGIINSTSGTIGGWLIDSTGLSKTVSGSSSYIYPSQIVLGIQNDEVSGTTTLSAARLFIEDVNYYVRVLPSGIEINDQIYGGTSYFKQFGAQLYGSMNLIGGTLTSTAVSTTTCNATTFNGTLNGTATYATTAGLRIGRILDITSASAGQDFIIANGNGSGVLRVASEAGVYSKVVTGRAVQVNSSDLIGTTASTARLKQDIEPYIFNEQAILSIEPKRFKYNEKVQHGGDDSDWLYGFIAEEAVTAGLSELCGFDEEGLPDYFAYERMCVAQQQIIRTLWSKVESLEARIQTLEGV